MKTYKLFSEVPEAFNGRIDRDECHFLAANNLLKLLL